MPQEQNQLTQTEEDTSKFLAKLSVKPTTQSAITLAEISYFGDLNWHDLSNELKILTKPLQDGDTSNIEDIMAAQIIVLDTLFNHLCMGLKSPHRNVMSEYLELALKVQKNCRNTANTLKYFKSQPVMVGQQNIA